MRCFFLFLIGLTFGAAGGFVYAAANGLTLDGHDHADPAQHAETDHARMHEEPVDLAPADAPSLEVEVIKDPLAGYNLHVITEGFTFSPRNAGGAHVPGEGHAHVYANGVKLGRLYAPWVHLDGLPQGPVEIEVTLTANDHRPLAAGGTPISASTTVTVE
ncbi:hypothetical protein ABMC89_12230 [Sulfitobacter sp. HNIBRBA3233]|uniref:hypothetical protein n=1 Tax=Sulfitobacter marinivivus TaxID=3158558 RepID=UPI0032DF789B